MYVALILATRESLKILGEDENEPLFHLHGVVK